MSSSFNINFKYCLQYIGKASSKEKDCPLNTFLLDKLINYIFNDTARASTLIDQYRDSKSDVDKKYAQFHTDDPSYNGPINTDDALSKKDRDLFKYIDLFPKSVSDKYPEYILWFSRFLTSGMKNEHMEFVWRYLNKMNEQVNK